MAGVCVPARPNPSVDARSGWSPAREPDGSGFVLSRGWPTSEETVCVHYCRLYRTKWHMGNLTLGGGYTIKYNFRFFFIQHHHNIKLDDDWKNGEELVLQQWVALNRSGPEWNKVRAIKKRYKRPTWQSCDTQTAQNKWQGCVRNCILPEPSRLAGGKKATDERHVFGIRSTTLPCTQKTWRAGLSWWASTSCGWRSHGPGDRQQGNED